MVKDYAILDNSGEYTIFTFEDTNIRFKSSSHLVKYTQILGWDEGYLTVMAKYDNSESDEEEYIDLVPILENLYFDVDEFLKPIKEVRLNTE